MILAEYAKEGRSVAQGNLTMCKRMTRENYSKKNYVMESIHHGSIYSI